MPSHFHIVVPVWGEFYRQTLLDFLLPSLLAGGNLPSWPFSESTRLRLFTSEEDALQIENSKVLDAIRSLCAVDMVIFELEDLKDWASKNFWFQDKYIYAHILQTLAFQDAHKENCSVLPLMADMVLSNGLLAYLAHRIQAGLRLLVYPSPRVRFESFNQASKPFRKSLSLEMDSQRLAQLILKTLHPHEQACFLDAEEFTNWPSHFYVQSPQGVMAHCLHMHPLYMHQPTPPQMQEASTIDTDYLNQYLSCLDQAEVLQNHLGSACSVSNPHESESIHIGEPLDLTRKEILMKFAKEASPLHLWQFKQGVLFKIP
ncbi:hypothetical protein COW36_04760 [bacterium (Candidatus Blackallbacteria) CG17_big_fil_post_rev_8_21_14_2_50_48_46]|uniref:Uncharacterized protein n=1 Tax=bacterium (Candidatus Blackallbacteria) CG17_big_fil_post_rev_8_21_14_2_50_48_46 TaxID=2014261 RepID=A0A2M7G912_9BACT|nr:MAG: hypothetical protein COW64_04185 [bacterium (Candidatus Blackallbacteria) CG18_big_fil_WC_8_21_14_2_50_49_26]PIW18606.1 MAG: hypothetical protein COW36_04760 [bacterium (Candidatus Blackallbacteria) CG17_big_fil_post_rev_8_21_14_2_50_48_46]PIW46408.1 MAG: hypothetical protein COW20_15920 [bacterium (Candidatus Blackallbacteria) CG13_big_fil_rev_8_21_14_2_50_49_14]